MDQLVAVTFTEKAAAELRHKLREKLTKRIQQLEPGSESHREALRGLAEVDNAAVGTIHSFALRLLRQYPLEAGLPLGFSVIDAGEAKKAFRQVSQEILDELLTPENNNALDKLVESEVVIADLVKLFQEIGSNLFKFRHCEFSTLNSMPHETESIIRDWSSFAHKKYEEALERRRSAGQINFDDLLLLAHELVSGESQQALGIRKDLEKKYKFFVVDEFQDTDPVQWQMIRCLVSDPLKQHDGPVPGKLVVVGDPKQSIYKFRGADITNFEKVRADADNLWGQGNQQHLIANFRSQPKIIDFVDCLYNGKTPVLGTDFEAMHAEVEATEDQGVYVLDPGDFAFDKALQKEREPEERRAIAAVIQSVVGKKYITTHKDEGGVRRLVRYADVALLIPSRTKLQEQLQLFEDLNIPYKSTDGTLVYSRPAVKGLISALRVIAGSVNGRDLWWALKSPLFGVDDKTLLEFKNQGNYFPTPISSFNSENVKGPGTLIRDALSTLLDLSQAKTTAQPSELLEILYESTTLHLSLDQLNTGGFEHSCIRMVILHAKQWEATGGSGLLDYIDWLNQMEDEEVRENLPSPDISNQDAITVSTMHSAKGLEYEIVILGSMKNGASPRLPMAAVGPKGNFEYQIYIATGTSKKERTEVYTQGYFDDCMQLEQRLDEEENQRLLYVAATRAKSYLYYSTFHQGLTENGYIYKPWSRYTRAQVLEAVEQGKAIRLEVDEMQPQPATFSYIRKPEVTIENELQLKRIDEAIAISETSAIKKPSDPESKIEFYSEALEQAASYGTAFHSIMEDVSLKGFDAKWEKLETKIAQRASEFKVSERIAELRADVLAALESDLISRAKNSEWAKSEQALNGFVEGTYTSGVADLYFEDKNLGGLVVVDYKTNSTLPNEVIEKYRKQLSDYALLLELASGKKVVERFLLHVQGGVVKDIPV
jgi:ATP-dependent helicase/nuclease subunit A